MQSLHRFSSQETIRGYFSQVLELKNSGKDFPVNLDDVWPLAYPRKDHAIRTLKTDFIQGVDYQIFPKNRESNVIDYQSLPKNEEQRGRGGHNKIEYRITVECLEYFIAKRVKPVFEVYRKVFHRAHDLLNTKPFMGVSPILYQGQTWYNYMEVLRALGYSTRSGSVRIRKHIYPERFNKLFGRNFIDFWMCGRLMQNSPNAQLSFNFDSRRAIV